MPSRLGLHGERQVEDAAGVVLALRHRLEAVDAGADRLDGVVGAVLEAVLEQDLLGLQRVGGVGRVDHEGAAAQVGEGLDLRLDEELVHAAVAAGDDHHVLLGDLDHGDRIVERGLGDVELAGGEAVALVLRIRRELQLDLQPVPFEDAVGDAGMQRQRLGVGKGVDAKLGRRLRHAVVREDHRQQRDCAETWGNPYRAENSVAIAHGRFPWSNLVVRF